MISALKPIIAVAAWAGLIAVYAIYLLAEVVTLGRKSPSARDFLEDE